MSLIIVLNLIFIVESCKTLLELEAKYSPSDYTSTINQIIDYYKKVS